MASTKNIPPGKDAHSFWARFLALTTVTYVAILLLVGLWPLKFMPKNNVSLEADGSGITIGTPSAIYSDVLGQRLFSRITDGERLVIEIVVAPRQGKSSEIGFILACGAVGRQYNFALVQQHTHLLFLLKTTEPPPHESIHSVEIRNVFSEEAEKHIAILYDHGMAILYVDGLLVGRFSFKGALFNWDKNCRFFVGNDDTGEHNWNGRIRRIALYDGATSVADLYSQNEKLRSASSLVWYDFSRSEDGTTIRDNGGARGNHHLFAPVSFRVMGKGLLSLPDRGFLMSPGFLKDSLVNLAGFVPLGLLLVAWLLKKHVRSKRAVLVAILAGFALSLAIELLQVLLPTRCSSLPDLVTNTVGTIIGALAATGIQSRIHLGPH